MGLRWIPQYVLNHTIYNRTKYRFLHLTYKHNNIQYYRDGLRLIEDQH